MNSLKIAALALVDMLAVGLAAGCGSSAAPSTSAACTTRASKGICGPYAYPQITRTTSSTYVGNDVWDPVTGWRQALAVTNPGKWQVTADIPAGNTSVVSYPSVGANYGQADNTSTPLSDFTSIYSSFSETMNATSKTTAWATYDIWLGSGRSSSWTGEVMIQHDFADNAACTVEATAVFGGSGGVPVQTWNLCQFGSELAWKLPGSEQAGRVDILPMVRWLVTHGYLPHDSGLWAIAYGWEICSTGGTNETFRVNHFSITANRS